MKGRIWEFVEHFKKIKSSRQLPHKVDYSEDLKTLNIPKYSYLRLSSLKVCETDDKSNDPWSLHLKRKYDKAS